MSSPFKHLDPEGKYKASSDAKFPLREPEGPEDSILYEVESLAEAARLFFVGVYPREAPYFSWGEGRILPWHDEYWPGWEGLTVGSSMEPIDIRDDIAEIALHLGSLTAAAEEADYLLTYFSPSLVTDKLKVQGLAVELLLALDRFLDLFLAGRHLDGIAVICEAYKYVSEMTIQAEDLLAREASAFSLKSFSKRGTDKRHQANRALRDYALQLYRQGKYPSPHKGID